MTSQEVSPQTGKCQGPWDVLDTPSLFTTTQGVVDCQFARGNLCTALASDVMLPTMCIQSPECEDGIPDVPQRFYVSHILEGTIIFDAEEQLILKSPNFKKSQKPVYIPSREVSQRLVLLMENVGHPVSHEQLSTVLYPDELTGRQRTRHNARSTVVRISDKLGKRPTKSNPTGSLIENVLARGYRFRAPAN